MSKGYYCGRGYVGWMPRLNKWILFPTEQEYLECFEASERIEDEDR